MPIGPPRVDFGNEPGAPGDDQEGNKKQEVPNHVECQEPAKGDFRGRNACERQDSGTIGDDYVAYSEVICESSVSGVFPVLDPNDV